MTTAHRPRLRRGLITLVGALSVTTLALAGCAAGDSGSTGSGTDSEKFTVLLNDENQNVKPVLEALSTGACATEEAAQPLEFSSIPQGDMDANNQLLASQDSLPTLFSAGGTPSEAAKLDKAGKLVHFDDALAALDATDDVLPSAKAVIEKLYGGNFVMLPSQYNIEGIFYNKQIFADLGIEVPTTWDELNDAAAKVQAAGYTALSASGNQGWPLTRLISGYLFRTVGPDALKAVQDGTAKLTDPEYVAAAQAIADLGAAGYFGANVTSLDYDGATNEFLTGKAAMIYMGSWLLGNINDPAQNKLPADSVGFMPFPAVDGGKGAIDQYPANVGVAITMSSSTFGPNAQAWLKCIADNFGTDSLKNQNTISGFAVNTPVDVPAITQEVLDRMADGGEGVLWFEALFNAKAGQDSSDNAPLLVTGQISPEDFMKTLQTDLDAG
ncbi:MAG: extracellular solute-binding protein [Leifsonia sp.]|nr:extracellular solute-binding protein [Leifsonia sp.]